MQFDRLRIAGFKSFVDPVEFIIEHGLTGIVGPNGCGKSNLVEAVRWVMGEHSARRMRGNGMDDVIFSGSGMRPARNIAEVVISLDNTQRKAPAAFNESDEIEVSRHIERENGSIYRINRREVRARDVQLLFADAASGAHSPALVGQGEIGAIIRAKPHDRRFILEEAAGISGLHSRRHEAELRLRAAETNLGRLDDVMEVLESQHQGLKRQVRQATRYRNISGHIRRTEAILLYYAWTEATADLERARCGLVEAEAKVEEKTRDAAATNAAQLEAAERLSHFRHDEAAAAARLSRLAAASDTLDIEERRLNEDQRRLKGLLEQISNDLAREETLQNDADEALSKLNIEQAELLTDSHAEEAQNRELRQRLEKENVAVTELDRNFQDLAARLVAEEARRTNLLQREEDNNQRTARTAERVRGVVAEQELLRKEISDSGFGTPTPPLEEELKATRRTRVALDVAENDRIQAEQEMEKISGPVRDMEARMAARQAELEALIHLLGDTPEKQTSKLASQVSIEGGYEVSVQAALGDDLEASLSNTAPIHWRMVAATIATPGLPKGATSLANFVKAPSVLTLRLSQIGVVDESEGSKLQKSLAQGQRLVSREGTLWRWDGLTIAANANAKASSLSQRNRRRHVEEEVATLNVPLLEAKQKLDEASSAVAASIQRELAAREASRAADDKLAEERDKQSAMLRANVARESRFSALSEAISDLKEELVEVERHRLTISESLATLLPTDEMQHDSDTARSTLEIRRVALAEAQRASDLQQEGAERRSARMTSIEIEQRSWVARHKASQNQLTQLATRHNEVQTERTALGERPVKIAKRRQDLLNQISEAEKDRGKAADTLAQAENTFAQTDRDARAAQTSQGEAREDRVRFEARLGQAKERCVEISARIQNTLSCSPEEALVAAELKEGAVIPEFAPTENRLERLRRERDNMGPVNLRAEAEAREIDEKLQTMRAEYADLEAAINRLRQGITRLNREGRERIHAAFTQVDDHFRKLFARLFGGGRAHLSLTESDDPLEAGLEIMASPPGKRLQTMSLLSGGEQALTAISLLFAVFLTNPAPVCVLDEVDAPLDDPNVELFLSLISDIAKQCHTRFLIVTHNPITMGRMDRLFGVTMSERGVSQVVSVDLVEAEALRAAE